MFDSGLPISVRRVKFRMFCVLILIHAGISLSPKIASAQLSPGKLTLAHEHLEGVRRCNSCHKLGDRNIVSKCLECHREIASSQEREHGLHALQGYANCNECHVEHQGRDHDLVFSVGRCRPDEFPPGVSRFANLGKRFARAILYGDGKNRRDALAASRVANPNSLALPD